MEAKVFSVKGEELRTIELEDSVFNCEISDGTIYYAINNELANSMHKRQRRGKRQHSQAMEPEGYRPGKSRSQEKSVVGWRWCSFWS